MNGSQIIGFVVLAAAMAITFYKILRSKASKDRLTDAFIAVMAPTAIFLIIYLLTRP